MPEALLKYLPALTRLTEAKTVDGLPESEDAPVAVCNGARLMLKVEIDKAAETARLSKEAEKLQKPWTNSTPNSPNPVTPKSPGIWWKRQSRFGGIGRQNGESSKSVGEVEGLIVGRTITEVV